MAELFQKDRNVISRNSTIELLQKFKSAVKWMKHLNDYKKTWQKLHMSKKNYNFATLL